MKEYIEYGMGMEGPSYIKEPRDHTFLFVVKKLQHVVDEFTGLKDCLVFAENGMAFSEEILKNNHVVFFDRPQLAFAEFTNEYSRRKEQKDQKRRLELTAGGYYMGDNVRIGDNPYIEPGVVIFHDVFIGKNAHIAANSVIRSAHIGDDFTCGENVTVGSSGHVYTKDENGKNYPFSSLGTVEIKDRVTIGTNSYVSRGSCGTTRIENDVKIGLSSQIGHEAHIGENTKIAGGVVISGYTTIGRNVSIGINASIRHSITIGDDSEIGMAAAVMRDVKPGTMVIGNPAKEWRKDLLHS